MHFPELRAFLRVEVVDVPLEISVRLKVFAADAAKVRRATGSLRRVVGMVVDDGKGRSERRRLLLLLLLMMRLLLLLLVVMVVLIGRGCCPMLLFLRLLLGGGGRNCRGRRRWGKGRQGIDFDDGVARDGRFHAGDGGGGGGGRGGRGDDDRSRPDRTFGRLRRRR